MYCKKCLTAAQTGRTGDRVGDPCKTPGCDGIIEEVVWADLVEPAGEQICPRRQEEGVASAFPLPDRWEKFKSIDNRVCSYCGSLHPDDMFRLAKESAEASEEAPYGTVVEVEPSDKSYKVYVHQPGVRNAHEGGVVFYMMHLPKKGDGSIDVSQQRQDDYAEAVRRTHVRLGKKLWKDRTA
jgi:hypothetical protein